MSTGRHHGFESQEEQRFLLALDFLGGVTGLVSQPFRLRAETTAGWREHIPDFLAVIRSSVHLVDVRPQELIKDEDRVLFAAAARDSAGSPVAVLGDLRPLITSIPPSYGAVAGSAASNSSRRALTRSGSHRDSERKNCARLPARPRPGTPGTSPLR